MASAITLGTGGAGPDSTSSRRTDGVLGSSGTNPAGGSTRSFSSETWDAKGPGDNTETEAPPINDPQLVRSPMADSGLAGADGNAGPSTVVDVPGAGFDARSDDSAAGGGLGDTGGSAGQTGEAGSIPGLADAASTRDSSMSNDACALCALGTALVHRYSFEGTGTKVTDSVGTAHGTVVNASLSGAGTLMLAGGSSGQYGQLPEHILSTLGSATLEVWVSWNGGNSNQRILDFGSSELANGKGQATSTVLISPNSAPDGISPRLRASYSRQVSHGGTFVDATSPLPAGAVKQIVAVFDGQRGTLSLYLNGALQGQTGGLEALSLINDSNNWLGRSQYTDDPGFSGTYDEFRIYNAPLTAEQVQAVYAAGPNASFNE